MGIFSDPASAPSTVITATIAGPKGNIKAVPRESPATSDNRARRSFRRSQTFDAASSSLSAASPPSDSFLSPEAEAREGRRRASRRASLSSGNSKSIPSRRVSTTGAMMDISMGSSSRMSTSSYSMHDHLQDIEQFLSVVKGADKKKRKQLLRSSLESKQDNQRNAIIAEFGA